jgi:hypothetical protein
MYNTSREGRSFFWVLYPVLLILFALGISIASHGQDNLEKIFLDPPEEAKPRGYWIWAHGNFDYATITDELKAFRQMGLGGADIFDMGITDPLDMIPPGNNFMGEKMLDGIEYALKEAKRLDLKMGLSVSNGWNAGGEWTEPDEMIMRLLFWKDTLQGPVTLNEIGFPEIPRTFEKPYGKFELFPRINEDGFPEYYLNVALVAYPYVEGNGIVDPEKVLHFDAGKISGNQVEISLPEGKWILARGVVTPLGQKMWMRSDRSNGFIMDHYSRKATRHHFEHIIGKLEERVGDLGETALERLYLASFEAEDYVIWSPGLREEFMRQHNYTIDPYIPVFAGQQVVDEETTERFLHDYRSTVSEMFVNNHYRQASEICREHGVLLASESGGPGPPLHYVPTEDLKALGSVDIMRGEFWNKHSRWITDEGLNLMQVVKNIASAAHIYGHKVVEMESFTSHNYHWQETPFELKFLADRAFCEGMTRVVYHTMPHSPPEAGIPGWSYQAGTHIHPKMTWWPMSKPFHQYLARCSALLMEGHFVAAVVYFYGSGIPNFAKPTHIRPDLGPGYDYDDLNTEILLQVTEVNNGKIRLPSGMEYEVLVLPDDQRMELEVLKKIRELLEKGATIIGRKPSRVYGLSNYIEKERVLRDLADQIWGKAEPECKRDKKYGAGRIITGKTPREVLLEKGVTPDLEYTVFPDTARLDYIHRTTGNQEIYFIRNADSLEIHAEIHLRVSGMLPELWDPDKGTMQKSAIFSEDASGIRIPLNLPAHGSVFVIFREPVGEKVAVSQVSRQGDVLFPGEPKTGIKYNADFNDDGSINFSADKPGQYMLTFSPDHQVLLDITREHIVKQEIDGPWDVRFPHGWGTEPLQRFDSLVDWSSASDPGLKYFSGTGTYRTSFALKESPIREFNTFHLDLGRVGEVARVYLNGVEVGISLFPPNTVEITGLLIPGDNHLVVEVANTWLNRLIGDLRLPLDEQYTRSNVARGNDPAHRPWSNYAPLPSGLMGPVSIRLSRAHIIDLKGEKDD